MRLKYHLTVVAAALALAGCSNNNDQTSPAATNSTAPATNSLIKEKDEFVASMDQKMKDLDAGIDDLSKKAEGYTGDAKSAADKALADLREQRAALGKKYDELKQSSQAAWEDTKAGFQSAWDDLEKSYENTKAKFS
jgi:chromosome segregation ATPase